VNGSYFAQNAASDGGGLYGESGLTIRESQFVSNTATFKGGGLYVGGELVAENTIFLSNTAEYDDGGGAFANDTAFIFGGLFEDNASVWDGGGLWTRSSTVVTGTFFIVNSADYGGGLYGADFQIDSSVFTGNAATFGGGLEVGRDGLIVNSLFAHNTAANDGGGLYVYGGYGGTTLALTRTQFISNTASYGGGGIYADTADLLIDSSAFTGNDGGDYGGGLYVYGGDGLIVNTLFAHNTASNQGSTLFLEFVGMVSLKHATIVGGPVNNAPGITLIAGGSLLLENSIVTRQATGIRNFSGDFYQDYNLFYQNGVNINGSFNGGANSLNGNPHFVAPQSGDFHIGPGSAALDAGRDAGVTVDFEGDSRPLGGGFDIGFDEADLIAGLAIAYSPSPTVTTQTPVSFTATVTSGSGIAYTWDFGDGSPVENGNPMLHSYTAPGLYTVMVTATNSSGSVSTSVELEVVQGEITLPEYWLYLPIILK